MNTELLSAHLTSARDTLEASVRDGREFAPMIIVVRDGLMIARVLPPTGDGGTIQRIAQLCVEGFRADEILLVIDSYLATGDGTINPVTGREYAHDEMADVATNHDGLAKGWVTECLTVLAVPRAGTQTGWSLPYFREADRSVTWGDPKNMDAVAGRLTDLYESTPLGGHLEDREMAFLLAGLEAVVMLAEYEDNRS